MVFKLGVQQHFFCVSYSKSPPLLSCLSCRNINSHTFSSDKRINMTVKPRWIGQSSHCSHILLLFHLVYAYFFCIWKKKKTKQKTSYSFCYLRIALYLLSINGLLLCFIKIKFRFTEFSFFTIAFFKWNMCIANSKYITSDKFTFFFTMTK
jgi:heme A synthase